MLEIDELPGAPLDASAVFHAEYLAKAIDALLGEGDHLTIQMPHADSDHDDWRRAVARDLARKFAPKRANILGGGSHRARDEMLAYLRGASGVTGQYLPLDE